MPLKERRNILSNLNCVDEVMLFDDDENGTCIDVPKSKKEISK